MAKKVKKESITVLTLDATKINRLVAIHVSKIPSRRVHTSKSGLIFVSNTISWMTNQRLFNPCFHVGEAIALLTTMREKHKCEVHLWTSDANKFAKISKYDDGHTYGCVFPRINKFLDSKAWPGWHGAFCVSICVAALRARGINVAKLCKATARTHKLMRVQIAY